MMTRDAEVRPARLRDLPLLLRLSEQGMILDSELGFTRDVDTSGLMLSVLPQRGQYTLLARVDKQSVAAQFRLHADNAHIVFVAPRLQAEEEDGAYLLALDALAQEAGRRSAHALVAEVDEMSPLFETMRHAGFAIYARQEIWRAQLPLNAARAEVEDITDGDIPAVQALIAATTPRLVQPVADVPVDGYVVRNGGRCDAYVGVARGKFGVFLMPTIHPGADAAAILHAAAARALRSDKLPVYVRVRRYQLWMEDVLAAQGFEPCAQQAVMVRHIAAGIRHTSFTLARHSIRHVPAGASETVVEEPVFNYLWKNESQITSKS